MKYKMPSKKNNCLNEILISNQQKKWDVTNYGWHINHEIMKFKN